MDTMETMKTAQMVWQAGYDEGRRAAFKEMLPLINQLKDSMAVLYDR